MHQSDLIDKLIQSGWQVLESDFDEGAFLHWRRQVCICISDLLGADNVYVCRLRDYVRQAENKALLAGGASLAKVFSQTTWRPFQRVKRTTK